MFKGKDQNCSTLLHDVFIYCKTYEAELAIHTVNVDLEKDLTQPNIKP